MSLLVALLGQLGTWLAVLFISWGRLLGPSAPSEHCLGAFWSQPVLPKTSKTVPKTIFGLKTLN